MRTGGGVAKGSSFERDVCRMLTKWITGKEKPEIFWRTANSGGKSRREKSSIAQGDITAIDEKGNWLTNNFSIECKFHKDFSFNQMFLDEGNIWDWWVQCVEAAEQDPNNIKFPMLIFKKNRFPICIALRNTYNIFDYLKGMDVSYLTIHSINYGDIIIFTWDDFITKYPYKDFKEFIQPLILEKDK